MLPHYFALYGSKSLEDVACENSAMRPPWGRADAGRASRTPPTAQFGEASVATIPARTGWRDRPQSPIYRVKGDET